MRKQLVISEVQGSKTPLQLRQQMQQQQMQYAEEVPKQHAEEEPDEQPLDAEQKASAPAQSGLPSTPTSKLTAGASGPPTPNPFLVLEGQEPKNPRRIYAVLDQAELGDDGVHYLLFGGVDADIFDEMRADISGMVAAGNFAGIFDAMRLFLLEVGLSSASVARLGPRGAKLLSADDQLPTSGDDPARILESLERRWIEFVLDGNDGAARGRLYRNLFGDAQEVRIGSAADPLLLVRQALNSTDPLRLEPDAADNDIQTALSNIATPFALEDLVVYDVGQGNATGLTAGRRVLAYFDFGGGVAGSKSSFPPLLSNFCFCNPSRPPIVLSHWDHDHWSSAARDNQAYYCTWIAPRQSLRQSKRAPHHNAFISTVKKYGKLLIWPSSTNSLAIGRVHIHKCKGTSKNASGLAMEIYPPDGTLGSPVLMPADAGYDDLPIGASTTFDAIVCPHHGGRSNSPRIPARPARPYARLAYSYGLPNAYKHPLPKTYQAHDSASWIDPRVPGQPSPGEVRNTVTRSPTGFGHIGFNWGAGSTPCPLPCSGACQLEIQQF